MMGFYVEHLNESANSKYPFSDAASLIDESGYRLSDSFLLDVSFCAWGSSVPYLSSLSSGVGLFSDKSGPIARFEYSGPGVWPVIDANSGLYLGSVVLGASASGIEESRFSQSATMLCPACFCLFSKKDKVVSFICDMGEDEVQLRGNVRIYGKNGIYVTKIVDSSTKLTSLRIDIIGHKDSVADCCDEPIRSVIVSNSGCDESEDANFPVISGALIAYPDVISGVNDSIIPGVIGLRSPLSADSVCEKTERVIGADGKIDVDYCDRPVPVVADPCEEIVQNMFVVVPANGNIDLIPYSPEQSGSPVYVHVSRPDSVSSFVSGMSDPSMKNLAMIENSGTVVLGLKGRS